MENLWIGVIGTVIGSILTFSGKWIYSSIILDLILRIRKEPRIESKWKTRFQEDGKEYSETVTLKQKGRNISAVIILIEDNEETEYHFKGTFRNLILAGTYVSTDETDFEEGAILLRYTSKKTFVGQNIFFSKTSPKLVPSNYEWERI